MGGPFKGKEIVLGVTGSIAAYKACELASRLVEAGASVTPVLTNNARAFVGAVTFEALTHRRAITAMFEPLHDPQIEHIALAQRTDLFLIAPATANIIAKAAHGIADDWLSTTLLATHAPVLFAPAMNTNMYLHAATQANIRTLSERGCRFVGPDTGMLACGTSGPGRLAETKRILHAAGLLLCKNKDLAGRNVLITSGPNEEPIDPVRFIGNRSSGRMGHALAYEALRRGAKVTVVTGPAAVPPPEDSDVIAVNTAEEMFDVVKKHLYSADVFIAAAAVADYRVDRPSIGKLKRGKEPITLQLIPNPDIAAFVGSHKRASQVTVGFAAETSDLIENATAKLRGKNLDFIIANQIGGLECAIGADTSNAHFIAPDGSVENLPRINKEALAELLFDRVVTLLAERPDNLPGKL